MAVRKPAPRASLNVKSDAMLVVASLAGMSADTDLLAVTKHPKHAPQRVSLSAATALAAVLTDEDGVSHTITVPAGGTIVIQRPIATLVKSGSGAVQVICEWFTSESMIDWNP